jgi:serine palmitoyltransferase
VPCSHHSRGASGPRIRSRGFWCKWTRAQARQHGQAGPQSCQLQFTGFAGNETIKVRAFETLRKYGVGTCGPLWHHRYVCSPSIRTILVMTNGFPLQIFTWTLSASLFSVLRLQFSTQGFSTIPCAISAFTKRGDIIFASPAINFTVQKGFQISRILFAGSSIMTSSLEDAPLRVEKERKRHGSPTRRFIVTEGIFEKDGMVDLPKLVSCSHGM